MVRAPGRICLLGEHQDYLGLEVISGALSLYVELIATPIEARRFDLHLKSVSRNRTFLLDQNPDHSEPRDYLASGLRLMIEAGYRFSRGYRIEIRGNLPIGKGVSSSSAMCVGWIRLLSLIADQPVELDPLTNARMAFETEVVAFREPGGMQDHVASAFGGLVHMDFRNGRDRPVLTELPIPAGEWILVDSGSIKETLGMLQCIRSDVESALERLALTEHVSHPARLELSRIPRAIRRDPLNRRLIATLINRNLVRTCRDRMLTTGRNDRLGAMINTHHRILSTMLGSSSERIDRLCTAALGLGASGAKVIGSGGGGCVLVYAAANSRALAEQLSVEGNRCVSIRIGDGVHRVQG